MHIAVVIFFAAAIVFYMLGLSTPAFALSALGLVFELLAWSTWIGTSTRSKKEHGSKNEL